MTSTITRAKAMDISNEQRETENTFLNMANKTVLPSLNRRAKYLQVKCRDWLETRQKNRIRNHELDSNSNLVLLHENIAATVEQNNVMIDQWLVLFHQEWEALTKLHEAKFEVLTLELNNLIQVEDDCWPKEEDYNTRNRNNTEKNEVFLQSSMLRHEYLCVTIHLVMKKWRLLHHFRAQRSFILQKLCLNLSSTTQQRTASNERNCVKSKKVDMCCCADGGGEERRLSAILSSLMYRWFDGRCREWHSRMTENELLQGFDDKNHCTDIKKSGIVAISSTGVCLTEKKSKAHNNNNESDVFVGRKKRKKKTRVHCITTNNLNNENPIIKVETNGMKSHDNVRDATTTSESRELNNSNNSSRIAQHSMEIDDNTLKVSSYHYHSVQKQLLNFDTKNNDGLLNHDVVKAIEKSTKHEQQNEENITNESSDNPHSHQIDYVSSSPTHVGESVGICSKIQNELQLHDNNSYMSKSNKNTSTLTNGDHREIGALKIGSSIIACKSVANGTSLNSTDHTSTFIVDAEMSSPSTTSDHNTFDDTVEVYLSKRFDLIWGLSYDILPTGQKVDVLYL